MVSVRGTVAPDNAIARKRRLTSPIYVDLDKLHTYAHTTRVFGGALTNAGLPLLARILALHGPNLNLLGTREPAIYGHVTLKDINAALTARATAAGHELICFQSNAEHELVARVQEAGRDGTAFIVINPAAFTHTSVALRDALAAVAIAFIEVHLSNPMAREPFRHHSFVSDLAVGTIAGLGADSYYLALEAVLHRLAGSRDTTASP